MILIVHTIYFNLLFILDHCLIITERYYILIIQHRRNIKLIKKQHIILIYLFRLHFGEIFEYAVPSIWPNNSGSSRS